MELQKVTLKAKESPAFWEEDGAARIRESGCGAQPLFAEATAFFLSVGLPGLRPVLGAFTPG